MTRSRASSDLQVMTLQNLKWEPGEKPFNTLKNVEEENRETNKNILAP